LGFDLASAGLRLPADHAPHFQSARAFHLDGSGGFAVELGANQIVGAARDPDRPALPMRFHAAREVHGRAPEIVDELLAADHAGDHRPTELTPMRATGTYRAACTRGARHNTKEAMTETSTVQRRFGLAAFIGARRRLWRH